MSETTESKPKDCLALKQPTAMSEEGDMATNWREWKSAFDYYMIATGMENASSREKCALFLHVIGKGGRNTLDELDLDNETESNYEKLVSKYALHYDPTRNVNYERHEFFKTYQNEDSFDKFFSILKIKSKSCEFGQLRSSLILTQIIRGLKDSDMREQLLGKPTLDLEGAVVWCRAVESFNQKIKSTSLQAKNSILQENASQRAIKSVSLQIRSASQEEEPCAGPQQPVLRHFQRVSAFSLCDYCGYKHSVGDKCLAWDAICYKCERLGHFARKCRGR